MGKGRAFYLAQERRPLTAADRRDRNLVDAYIRYGGDPNAVQAPQQLPSQKVSITNHYYYGPGPKSAIFQSQPIHASDLAISNTFMPAPGTFDFNYQPQQDNRAQFMPNSTYDAAPASTSTSTAFRGPVAFQSAPAPHHPIFAGPPGAYNHNLWPPVSHFAPPPPYSLTGPQIPHASRFTELNPTMDKEQPNKRHEPDTEMSDDHESAGHESDPHKIKQEELDDLANEAKSHALVDAMDATGRYKLDTGASKEESWLGHEIIVRQADGSHFAVTTDKKKRRLS